MFGRDKSRRDGLQPWCRACHAAHHDARKPLKVEKAPSPPPTEKRCTKCGTVKPVADFNLHGSKPGYLAPSCRACQSAHLAGWRLENPEKVRAGQEDHYERNRTARIAKAKAWSTANPDRRAEIGARNDYVRRARISRHAPVSDGTKLADIVARDGLNCYLCGEPTALDLPRQHPKKTVRDHYMPIRLGGTHTADNLRVACWRCNNWKSGRHPDKATALIAKRLEARRAAEAAGAQDTVGGTPPDLAATPRRKPPKSR
jgi:5-methylcytosine-specific restriction endonuclease McrA